MGVKWLPRADRKAENHKEIPSSGFTTDVGGGGGSRPRSDRNPQPFHLGPERAQPEARCGQSWGAPVTDVPSHPTAPSRPVGTQSPPGVRRKGRKTRAPRIRPEVSGHQGHFHPEPRPQRAPCPGLWGARPGPPGTPERPQLPAPTRTRHRLAEPGQPRPRIKFLIM